MQVKILIWCLACYYVLTNCLLLAVTLPVVLMKRLRVREAPCTKQGLGPSSSTKVIPGILFLLSFRQAKREQDRFYFSTCITPSCSKTKGIGA